MLTPTATIGQALLPIGLMVIREGTSRRPSPRRARHCPAFRTSIRIRDQSISFAVALQGDAGQAQTQRFALQIGELLGGLRIGQAFGANTNSISVASPAISPPLSPNARWL